MRHIEKIKINGTEYNLLGFSSYSFLPASASSWTELYRQGGDNYPWDMTAGHSFTTDTDLFPSLTAEGYPHHLDDYSEAYINKWYASSWNGIVFGLYYDPSNTIIDYGYMNNGNEVNSTEMFGIILDDENRVGWMVLKHCYYPNNPTTVIGCIGGNSEMGQTIYSIFGIPATLSGGAGSGYIGNLLLSNKKMVGYNVPTSSAESTKTESVNEASENPVSGKPKIGNGFARIKFLRAVKSIDILSSVVENYYMSSYNCGPDDGLSHISSRCPDIIPYLETDKCICFGQTNKKALVSESSMFKYENTMDTSGSMELIPIGTKRVKNISFKYQKPYSNNPEWNHFILKLVNIGNDGTLNENITVVSDKDSIVSQEWHNISYTCDAEITHIATEGVQSTWYMKDLQIAYVND